MAILAIKQIQVLLELLQEDQDLRPYVKTLTPEERQAIVFVLVQLNKDVKS